MIKSKLLSDNQIATGVKCGAEAAAHAMQLIWDTLSNQDDSLTCDPSKIYIGTTDLAAAYQGIDQGLILNEMANNYPRFFPLVAFMFKNPIKMIYNKHVILSEQGVTQGSCLGSMLFCAGFAAMDRKIEAGLGPNSGELFKSAFADDTLFVGTLEAHLKRLEILEKEGPEMGIYLNKAKSKVIMPMSAEEEIKRYPKDFERMQGGGLVVLGAPVGTKEFVQEFIDDKITKVEVLLEKIKTLENPQVIGALIKQCVQGPKLAHLMRTTNPEDTKDQWKRYDAVSQGILEYMVGAPIKPKEWEMATMRKDESGLGLVNFPHTAPICFVASISASRPLQTHLLKKFHPITQTPTYRDHSGAAAKIVSQLENAAITTETIDQAINNSAIPSMDLHKLLSEKRSTILKNSSCKAMKAVIMSGSGPGAGAWMEAYAYKKTKMENTTYTTALRMRMGMKVSDRHKCSCGQERDEYGVHALVCKKGFRTKRHNDLRDTFAELAREAGLDATVEPPGYQLGLKSDGKPRPADVLIRNWSGGKCAAFDMGVSCVTSMGNVAKASKTPLATADAYAQHKNDKYRELCRAQDILFVPLIVETHGAWTHEAVKVFKRLAEFTAAREQSTIAHAYKKIMERMSAVLQIGNARMINGQL